MCGIFGVIVRPGAELTAQKAQDILNELYIMSESRGKESAGLHMYLPVQNRAYTLKGSVSAKKLIASREYKETLSTQLAGAFENGSGKATHPAIMIAHSRLVTNGTAEIPENNQPVRKGAVSMIHNGICVNVDALWDKHSDLDRAAEVDTEVLAALVNESMAKNVDPIEATQTAYTELFGAASVAWVDDRLPLVTLATNTGDLYYADALDKGYFIFASERFILETVLKKHLDAAAPAVEWAQPARGTVINTGVDTARMDFGTAEKAEAFEALAISTETTTHSDIVLGTLKAPVQTNTDVDLSLVRYNPDNLKNLKRCTKCVLPETFPYITFNAEGVCSYCQNYKPRYAGMHETETKKAFIESLEKYRRAGIEPDVIVPFSGGRDSCHGLHLIKEEFGLKPTTFTYDWGMVTDLARRNTARMCGELGVQNILVSADLAFKRENIRKNVSAWLKNPQLGLVPLFMAGDKHFFKIVNDLKRQTGIDLDLWCANPLENTDFKSGFCGVPPDFDKSRVDYLSFGRKAKMASYYAGHFLKNPRYINKSVLDTVGAFMAYYFEPRHDFYFIFDHFIWNEDEVNDVLINQYDFELSPDSPSSWRIGDGTAPFYNYIYMTARGFTEFDTFRSNQIREGQITREYALSKIYDENAPRIPSLQWYLDTVGLDFNSTIKTINTLDTMGLHQ